MHVYFINTLAGEKVIHICCRNVICLNTESASISLVYVMCLLFCVVACKCQVVVVELKILTYSGGQ